MNDKLKKALKIGAIALGVCAYSFLCFSVGACAARKGNETKADEIGLRSMAKAPKYAPSYQNGQNLFDNPEITARRDRSSYSFSDPFTIQYGNQGEGNSLYGSKFLPKGYYYFVGTGDSFVVSGLDQTQYTVIFGALWNDNVGNVQVNSEGMNAYFWPGYHAGDTYYFYSDGTAVIFGRGNINTKLYLVDALEVPVEDYITLPGKWSPLSMFGGDIGQNGNILTNSEMLTGYQQEIVLWGFLFRNQGVVYNRIRIILAWLGGSQSNISVGYLDSNGTFIQGTSSQWIVCEVQYALNFSAQLTNNVDDEYCYKAGACGVDYNDTRVAYKSGINWVNNNANVLEVVDKEYKTENGTRYSYGGISIGSNLDDLDFLKAYNDFTSGEIGMIGTNGNVFELLSSGFNAFLPILNIGIVPGITFGLLLFMPIMVAIIVIIIKVVKK